MSASEFSNLSPGSPRGLSLPWRAKMSLEVAALMVILALAFYMGMIPKQEDSYPVHVDEWVHYGMAQATLESGSITYTEPVFGRGPIERSRRASYHIFLAELKEVLGIDWLTLFRVFPALIFALISFQVYMFSRHYGSGLESALMVAFIPTTLRFLGPGFMVPVSVGMLFLPVVLLLAHVLEFRWKAVLLLLVSFLFIFTTHGTSTVVLSLIIVVHLLVFTLVSGVPWAVRLRRAFMVVLPVVLSLALVVYLGFIHCWQSAQVGQIRTREDYYYEELRGSSLRVLL